MSHVDDGTLHAYLDGELSALEVARLEGHLAECAPCRARLVEEKDVVARAARILALAEPPAPERGAPPLHQLRHPQLQWRVRAPLAWAASVVLVAGATWFALRPPGRLAPESRESRGFAETDSDSLTHPGALSRAQETSGADLALRSEVQPGEPQDERRDQPLADVAARLQAQAPAAPPPAQSLDSTRQLSALGAGRAESAAARDSLPNFVIDGVQIRGAPAAAAEHSTTADAVELDSARALLGTDVLAIDRLPITSVRRAGGGTVVVEQRLPSGGLIQLRQQLAVAGKASVSMREGPQQIAGRVTDAASGVPVANAEILATETALRAFTDELGAFTIDSVEPGAYRLRARKIGYEAMDLSAARVDSGRTTNIEFALRPVTVELAEVVVTGVAEERRMRRQAAPAATPAPRPPALWRQVGRLRVEISGPVAADSLGKLLESVKPIR